MSIRHARIEIHRFDPAETELRLVVIPSVLDENTQVKGRLMGPRCPYAQTVEIAYPWREIARTADHILLRTVIPEASSWDPQSPFVYEGPLELWQDDTCLERATVRHGLRQLNLGPRGLRLNGKVFALRGVIRERIAEQDLKELRSYGINLVILPANPENQSAWVLAERLGMLLLGQWGGEKQFRAIIGRHACHLGWLGSVSTEPRLWTPEFFEIGQATDDSVTFMICWENMLGYLPADMPRIVLVEHLPPLDVKPPAGWLGWVIA